MSFLAHSAQRALRIVICNTTLLTRAKLVITGMACSVFEKVFGF